MPEPITDIPRGGPNNVKLRGLSYWTAPLQSCPPCFLLGARHSSPLPDHPPFPHQDYECYMEVILARLDGLRYAAASVPAPEPDKRKAALAALSEGFRSATQVGGVGP